MYLLLQFVALTSAAIVHICPHPSVDIHYLCRYTPFSKKKCTPNFMHKDLELVLVHVYKIVAGTA